MTRPLYFNIYNQSFNTPCSPLLTIFQHHIEFCKFVSYQIACCPIFFSSCFFAYIDNRLHQPIDKVIVIGLFSIYKTKYLENKDIEQFFNDSRSLLLILE